MNTRLLKKIKKRYVYFWHHGQLHAYDKKLDQVVPRYECTLYWMLRNACGFFIAQKYLNICKRTRF